LLAGTVYLNRNLKDGHYIFFQQFGKDPQLWRGVRGKRRDMIASYLIISAMICWCSATSQPLTLLGPEYFDGHAEKEI
jgi:hypothetical protein